MSGPTTLPGGWTVLAGRTDEDNERLSLSIAKPNDRSGTTTQAHSRRRSTNRQISQFSGQTGVGIRRGDETDDLQLGAMDHEAALAAALGIIHRAIGRAQQFVGGLPVARR